MEKLSYADAVRLVREAVAEHPEGTNPVDSRGLCLYNAKTTNYPQKSSARPNCIVGTVLVAAGLDLPEEETGWWDEAYYDEGDTPSPHCAAKAYIDAGYMSRHTAMLLGNVQGIFDKHTTHSQTWGGTWAHALAECQNKGML